MPGYLSDLSKNYHMSLESLYDKLLGTLPRLELHMKIPSEVLTSPVISYIHRKYEGGSYENACLILMPSRGYLGVSIDSSTKQISYLTYTQYLEKARSDEDIENRSLDWSLNFPTDVLDNTHIKYSITYTDQTDFLRKSLCLTLHQVNDGNRIIAGVCSVSGLTFLLHEIPVLGDSSEDIHQWLRLYRRKPKDSEDLDQETLDYLEALSTIDLL